MFLCLRVRVCVHACVSVHAYVCVCSVGVCGWVRVGVCTMSVRCGHVLPACLTSCNLLISALVSTCMVARKLSKYTTFVHSCKPPLFCYCTFNISFLHQCSRLTPYCFVPPVHILSWVVGSRFLLVPVFMPCTILSCSSCSHLKLNGWFQALEVDGVKGEWHRFEAHGQPAPECRETEFTRDNHLGNGLGGHPNTYNWTVPNIDQDNCVLRMRSASTRPHWANRVCCFYCGFRSKCIKNTRK